MKDKFYTQEQKDVLGEIFKSEKGKLVPLSESTGAALLDVLGEQQNTLQHIFGILQRIEAILMDK